MARTCILRAFGLQTSYRFSLVIGLFCFVFVFLLSLVEPPPFVQSFFVLPYACMHPDSHMQLPTGRSRPLVIGVSELCIVTLRRAHHRFLTRCIGRRKHHRADHPISYYLIWTRFSRREVRASRRLYAGGGSCLRDLWRAWRIRDCRRA